MLRAKSHQGRWPESTSGWYVTHDFGFVFAGAERVSQVLAQRVLPGAPVGAIAGSDEVLEQMAGNAPYVRFLPRALVNERTFRHLTPLYPGVIRRLSPLEGNVLSSSYAFAHHIPCTGKRIIYCHTPLRQVWSGSEHYAAEAAALERLAIRHFGPQLREADLLAARKASLYVAASEQVRKRIYRYYSRDSEVLHPPVDTTGTFAFDRNRTTEDYFLWVGRIIEPYKRLQLTIEAFRGSSSRLLVVGDGRDRARLEAVAPENVTFLGWRKGKELADLYGRARALVFPSEDDFGLVPVEAMACGTPSVAFRRGGATETVVEDVTGIFFDEPTVASMRKALDEVDRRNWDRPGIAKQAERYSTELFARTFRDLVQSVE